MGLVPKTGKNKAKKAPSKHPIIRAKIALNIIRLFGPFRYLKQDNIMKTFLYVADSASPFRGYNRTISVYRVKNNAPEFLGSDAKINTASYCGDSGTAREVIRNNAKLSKNEKYHLLSI